MHNRATHVVEVASTSVAQAADRHYISRLLQRRFTPDLLSYSAAIDACAKEGQWQQAVSCLSTMQDRGILPDVVAYTTVLHVCSKSRQWPMVLGLVREMHTKGFAMSRTTANTVIHDMQVSLHDCVAYYSTCVTYSELLRQVSSCDCASI
jgi:pentatricopeptide repeat protein